MSGCIIYITGLSGSGKTTIAKRLHQLIPHSILLDGDEIRNTINKDLGFNNNDKKENIRRNNELIKLLYNQGFTVICSFLASIPEERDKLFDNNMRIIKVQLTTPLEVCMKRDPKNLYKSHPSNLAGYDVSYTLLSNPDIVIDTSNKTLDECVRIIKEKYDSYNID